VLQFAGNQTDRSIKGFKHMSRSEILVKFEDHNVLPTPQRLEVAEVLLSKPQHLSADQIIERLRDENSSVSKATVYNTLKLFEERGLIKECLVDPERRFYDSTTQPHHHFYNADTGQLSDIPIDDIEVSGLPQLPAGTQLEAAELILRVRNTAA
jgi:Fur family iron response transcriptional regulator